MSVDRTGYFDWVETANKQNSRSSMRELNINLQGAELTTVESHATYLDSQHNASDHNSQMWLMNDYKFRVPKM